MTSSSFKQFTWSQIITSPVNYQFTTPSIKTGCDNPFPHLKHRILQKLSVSSFSSLNVVTDEGPLFLTWLSSFIFGAIKLFIGKGEKFGTVFQLVRSLLICKQFSLWH